jgi:hypothetical protein
MKLRIFSTLAVALVFAFVLAGASTNGEKAKKAPAAKKEMKSCCSPEGKGMKDCSDMEMKHTDAKDAQSSHKSDAAKTEKKQDVSEGEKK